MTGNDSTLTDQVTAPTVELRYACRVGRSGLATLRRDPRDARLIRLAVGARVRFTLADDDAAHVRDAVELARLTGQGTAALADGTGFYLTRSHRVWHRDEDVFRLSIGSPLRVWLWRPELTALAAVLARFAADTALAELFGTA